MRCSPPRVECQFPGGAGPEHPRGFTLLELMVAIVVLAVLLGVAAPTFTDVMRNRRLTSQINQLVYSLALTRSEAVKRVNTVTACKSATGSACGTVGVDWEDGWIVFSDPDGDQVFDAADGEVILQINQALLDGFTMRGSADVANAITLEPSGVSRAQGIFVLCAEGRTDYARLTDVSLAGRIAQGEDSDEDRIPESMDGTEITSCTSP
jgi:type IV fimbrial biogenesis protein FimT